MVTVLVELSKAFVRESLSVCVALSSSDVVVIDVSIFGGVVSRVRVKRDQFVFLKVIFSRVRLRPLIVVRVGWWSLIWSGRTLKM